VNTCPGKGTDAACGIREKGAYEGIFGGGNNQSYKDLFGIDEIDGVRDGRTKRRQEIRAASGKEPKERTQRQQEGAKIERSGGWRDGGRERGREGEREGERDVTEVPRVLRGEEMEGDDGEDARDEDQDDQRRRHRHQRCEREREREERQTVTKTRMTSADDIGTSAARYIDSVCACACVCVCVCAERERERGREREREREEGSERKRATDEREMREGGRRGAGRDEVFPRCREREGEGERGRYSIGNEDQDH
jgi:hypothetical protein